MAQEKQWKQLNNIPEKSLYIEFPLAFTGKASAFEGLYFSCQFMLADIHTMNKAFRQPAKLTYAHFVEKFGMSKETVSIGINTMIDRGIIKREGQSRYVIIPKYRKNDYVEVDNYWLRHEWEVNGENKRLARSRLLTLALLKRGCENPKTGGEFVSSQARIGKAVNLPRTTAGDSVRELIVAGAIQSGKADGNDKRKRGCSLYTVNPAILEVKHPERMDKEAVQSFEEYKADELHKRFMLDTKYRELTERIDSNSAEKRKEILHSFGEQTATLDALEAETVQLRAELESYLKARRVKRDIFPPGFFKCDLIEDSQF